MSTEEQQASERSPEKLARLQAFRERLETIIPKAIAMNLDPMNIAGAFVTVGLVVLTREFTREHAVAYLRELANEVEETGKAMDAVLFN